VFSDLGVFSPKLRPKLHKSHRVQACFTHVLEDIIRFHCIKTRPHLTNPSCCGTQNSGVLCVFAYMRGLGEVMGEVMGEEVISQLQMSSNSSGSCDNSTTSSSISDV
jgi:hypothetical protein